MRAQHSPKESTRSDARVSAKRAASKSQQQQTLFSTWTTRMSAPVDIHAQLASILERFAKCALLEMSRAVETEMTRRQMEVETLLLKLQFTESELRSARQNQANLRSVGIQVNNSGQRGTLISFKLNVTLSVFIFNRNITTFA